ncbi:hypothetical protein [Streptosporangium sp. NPDC048865]|uniref:hypothetical protein n=1 Tax=Streptosporangium sp. NPDC048865 TaxID=3155766 RepID=UPI003416CA25
MTTVLIETIPGLEPVAVTRPVVVRWPRPTTGVRPRVVGPERRDVATRLAKRRLLIERLTDLCTADVALLKSARRDKKAWMCPGDDESVFLGRDRIGYVGMPETGYTLAIRDADAFFEWMEDEYPTEVMWTVELTSEQFLAFRDQKTSKAAAELPAKPSVRPAFWKVLAEGAKTGQTVHPRTGELFPIPGLAVNPTNPSPTFHKAPGIKHPRIAHAAHSGDLSPAEVAALLDLPTPTVQTGGT